MFSKELAMQIRHTVLSREEIAHRVQDLGQELTRDYAGKKPVLLGVLNGAFIFLADLVRAIALEVEVDFIRVASYGQATQSSGSITLSKAPELELQGKDVLLVEDIVDSGTTLAWLQGYIPQQYATASLKTCTLIDKQERRQLEIAVDYVGFQVSEGFLVGYGLDCGQRWRTLPDICAVQVDSDKNC
jgi:hypoxanthine phosphoribosyltransferase